MASGSLEPPIPTVLVVKVCVVCSQCVCVCVCTWAVGYTTTACQKPQTPKVTVDVTLKCFPNRCWSVYLWRSDCSGERWHTPLMWFICQTGNRDEWVVEHTVRIIVCFSLSGHIKAVRHWIQRETERKHLSARCLDGPGLLVFFCLGEELQAWSGTGK